jgi:xanthine/uracil permease
MAAAAKDAPPPLWHEVQEQMPGLRYCINDNPVWPEAVILGFQHYIVNLGTIVIFTNTIVPLMGGDNNDKARVLETILFVSGVNTLIQTTIGSRLPVVMGISFAYIVPIISVINDGNLQTIADPQTVSVTHSHSMPVSPMYEIGDGCIVCNPIAQCFKDRWKA